MKTLDLITLTTRHDYIIDEITKLSNSIIYKLLLDLRPYLGLFYKLCEHVAKLDVIQSLAHCSSRNMYVRPKFNAFTEVQNGHHPLLDFLCDCPPVPNLISICPEYNMHIITGPNGSGKSIYIRQVMMLQIMAQIGCYVPASSATFRPADRMFARIYLEDNADMGASTFVLEMREVVYMLSTVTNNSLFIIDELCRSTSLEEGTTLAMAICERLSTTKAFVFITTHYTMLTKLTDLYLNFKVWHMNTVASGTNARDATFNFKYNLVEGSVNLDYYGVFMTRNIWPNSVVAKAYEFLDLLSNSNVVDVVNQVGATSKCIQKGLTAQMRLEYRLYVDLIHLKRTKKFTQANINTYLNRYRNELEKLGFNSENAAVDPKLLFVKNEQNQEADMQKYTDENNEPSEESVQNLQYPQQLSVQIKEIHGVGVSENEMYSLIAEIQDLSQALLDDGEFEQKRPRTSQSIHQEEQEHIYPTANVNTYSLVSSFSDENQNQVEKSFSNSLLASPSNTVDIQEEGTNVPPTLKRRFTVPAILQDTSSSTTAEVAKKRAICHGRSGRFKPPTKREIAAEFTEQNRQLFERSKSSTDCSKYVNLLMNRPTVKQIQKMEHLAMVRRTSSFEDDKLNQVEVVSISTKCANSDIFESVSVTGLQPQLSIFSDRYAISNQQQQTTISQSEETNCSSNFSERALSFNHQQNFYSLNTPSFASNNGFYGDSDGENIDDYLQINNANNDEMEDSNANFEDMTQSSLMASTVAHAMFQKEVDEQKRIASCFSPIRSIDSESSEQYQREQTPFTRDGFYTRNCEDITNLMNRYLNSPNSTSSQDY